LEKAKHTKESSFSLQREIRVPYKNSKKMNPDHKKTLQGKLQGSCLVIAVDQNR